MLDIDAAVGRVEALLAPGTRVLLGIVGPPGAGKTTLAERVVAAFGDRAAHVPMDGFHLADVALDALGRRNRKGAIDTFDGWGYRSLLQRLRDRADEPVYAPGFERTLEQPIAGSIRVDPRIDLVVTEGNYLLAQETPWPAAAALLDEVWWCEAPDLARHERLVARHVAFGKAPDAAEAWVDAVDLPNARLIQATRVRADVEVTTG